MNQVIHPSSELDLSKAQQYGAGISIRDLVLERTDGERLLGPLSLDLLPGARLGLAGESGSGKSLLVQALFGVLPRGVRQVQGSIFVSGTDLMASSKIRELVLGSQMAWVPQDPSQALNPFICIGKSLTLLPKVHRRENHREALERLEPLLQKLRLPREKAFLNRFPHELSGGQRQRVCLAMALSCDPLFLILDEPTTALDPTLQADFISLVDQLQQERALAFLWITHDMGVVAAVARQLLVLYGGFPMEAGPVNRILESPRHPYTQRLLSAARREPATEAGFLQSPGQRPRGCPFQPRCPNQRPSCEQWKCWRGEFMDGFRCESPLHHSLDAS